MDSNLVYFILIGIMFLILTVGLRSRFHYIDKREKRIEKMVERIVYNSYGHHEVEEIDKELNQQ